MKTISKRLVYLFLTCCLLASCAAITETRKKEYGILKSAVMFSSEKVIGEYGDKVPSDFDDKQFIELIDDRMPGEYLRVLKNYRLEIEPHGWYYLIKVYDESHMILFDYSCTTELDGPILDSPEMFNPGNLKNYDHCE